MNKDFDFNREFEYAYDDDSVVDISSHSKSAFEPQISAGDSRFNIVTGNSAERPIYRKKKSGIAGFLSNISYNVRRWWSRLKKGQKTAFISLTSLILALLLLIVWFFTVFNYNYRKINTDDLGFEGVINEKIINVALFGIDSRDEKSFKGLSDSIMIMSLNTETKKVKIISLMRDTLVPIEKDGKTTYNKLTTAYKTGGPELAIKTINKCFDLDISEYATVNFYGMADIIDAVGGIDVTLTEREVKSRGKNNHGINDMIEEVCLYMDESPKDHYVTVSGDQHLNGIQAVAYARIRYVANIWGTNNDYGRTDRQRYVMEQLFNKATKMKKTQYIKLAKSLIPCSETSLSYSDILNLATNILLHSPTFEQSRAPQDEWNMPAPSGSFGSVVYFDLDYAAKAIHGVIYDDLTMEEFTEQNPVEKNDWYGKRGSTSYKPQSSKPEASKPDNSTTPSGTSSSTSTPKPDKDEDQTSTTPPSGEDSDNTTTEPDDATATPPAGEDTDGDNDNETPESTPTPPAGDNTDGDSNNDTPGGTDETGGGTDGSDGNGDSDIDYGAPER